ncbi:MAG TPA: YkgJ family cysteine cluster protein [Methanospirillum sp.]|uniref:YkgJ family cysteine cluster protein n=1 Tax=Methanospirillum sp. TaxID=45200 RepID=UPI002BF54EC1|nr:YkgJ family cysteine cluster protein [Methanospirillum sp.]HOJ95992.1 YkgJ family cysteine cluster protein [Methanospirillum sp.]HOL41370.1 YkgJ family cysteine cluster protein [Methanospirillum sp.]HPP77775.1 YkgJ family cysteine cluster protein [Methanospirillum sp.]
MPEYDSKPGICSRCGCCCSYMADVFGIIEQTGPFTYRIQYLITGVQQVVTIDQDKREIFSTTSILDKRPLACPFLRFDDENLAMCTVHQTRPELCRMYLCDRCKKG